MEVDCAPVTEETRTVAVEEFALEGFVDCVWSAVSFLPSFLITACLFPAPVFMHQDCARIPSFPLPFLPFRTIVIRASPTRSLRWVFRGIS